MPCSCMFLASIRHRPKLTFERIFFHARHLGTASTRHWFVNFSGFSHVRVRYINDIETKSRPSDSLLLVLKHMLTTASSMLCIYGIRRGHLMYARLTSKVWPIFLNRCCKSTFSHFAAVRVAGRGAKHNTLTLFKYSKGNNEPYAKGLNVDLHSAIGGRWSAIAKSDTQHMLYHHCGRYPLLLSLASQSVSGCFVAYRNYRHPYALFHSYFIWTFYFHFFSLLLSTSFSFICIAVSSNRKGKICMVREHRLKCDSIVVAVDSSIFVNIFSPVFHRQIEDWPVRNHGNKFMFRSTSQSTLVAPVHAI